VRSADGQKGGTEGGREYANRVQDGRDLDLRIYGNMGAPRKLLVVSDDEGIPRSTG